MKDYLIKKIKINCENKYIGKIISIECFYNGVSKYITHFILEHYKFVIFLTDKELINDIVCSNDSSDFTYTKDEKTIIYRNKYFSLTNFDGIELSNFDMFGLNSSKLSVDELNKYDFGSVKLLKLILSLDLYKEHQINKFIEQNTGKYISLIKSDDSINNYVEEMFKKYNYNDEYFDLTDDILLSKYMCIECGVDNYFRDRFCCMCHKNTEPSLHIGVNLLNYLKKCKHNNVKPSRKSLEGLIKDSLPVVPNESKIKPSAYINKNDVAIISNELLDKIINYYLKIINNNNAINKQNIKSVEVKNLFGYNTYKIEFNDRFSIIFGANGIGKTTLFNLIEDTFIVSNEETLLEARLKYIEKVPFERIKIMFTDDNYVILSKNVIYKSNNTKEYSIYFTYSPHGFDAVIPISFKSTDSIRLKIENLKKHYANIERLFPKFMSNERRIHFLFIRLNSKFRIEEIKKNLLNNYGKWKDWGYSEFQNIIEHSTNVSFLEDFNDKLLSAQYKLFFESGNNELFTKIIKEYENYLNSQKVIINSIQDFDEKFEYFWNKTSFIKKINSNTELFNLIKNFCMLKYYYSQFYFVGDYSKKEISYRNNSICIAVKESIEDSGFNSIINFSDLSSGELNIFTILYNLIFNTDNNPPIILIDEPEISLHVAWQRQLGEIIKEIASKKSAQIILASHSPFIATGNEDYIVNPEGKNE